MITKTETKKVLKELTRVQKGCSARTIDCDKLKDMLWDIENHIEYICIKKCNLRGLKVTLCSNFGGKIPASYKAAPMCTFITFEFKASLKLISVKRDFAKGNNVEFMYEYTKEQKDDIINHFSKV